MKMEGKEIMIYSKTCLIRHLFNLFPCVIQHCFSFPFDDFLFILHCVFLHPVYFDIKFLSQCMSDWQILLFFYFMTNLIA